MVREAQERQWVSVIFFLAALYNVAWGAIAVTVPVRMLAFVGIKNPGDVEFWQCIGMLVGLYGVGYWFASNDPARYWPFVFIGLIGKVFGPVGALVAIVSGHLPLRFLWVNVTNDFIWWAPFAWALLAVHRWNLQPGSDKAAMSLYRRLIGRPFDELMPKIRRFHDSTRPVEVCGVFRVTRGESAVGNWLTDIARFPRSQDALPVALAVDPRPQGEVWRRSFAGTLIESRQFEAQGLLAERFGPLVIRLEPQVLAGALEITSVRSTLLGVPLLPFLAPQVWARGTDHDNGIHVTVRISCSLLGLLVEYKGVVSISQ